MKFVFLLDSPLFCVLFLLSKHAPVLASRLSYHRSLLLSAVTGPSFIRHIGGQEQFASVYLICFRKCTHRYTMEDFFHMKL